jgi:hypothetical protein
LLFSLSLSAQHGTAPNGYYPQNFSGSIFTGSLESATADTQEITLAYSKGNKSERFVGRLESACGWKGKDGAAHSFKADEIPKGTVLTALYINTTKKTGGQKINENSIFAISYVEFDGKRIPRQESYRFLFGPEVQRFQSLLVIGGTTTQIFLDAHVAFGYNAC